MKTLIIGASNNPDRYAFKAAERLLAHGHEIELLGIRPDMVFSKMIDVEKKTIY
jgi:predicted CoA-binding protein